MRALSRAPQHSINIHTSINVNIGNWNSHCDFGTVIGMCFWEVESRRSKPMPTKSMTGITLTPHKTKSGWIKECKWCWYNLIQLCQAVLGGVWGLDWAPVFGRLYDIVYVCVCIYIRVQQILVYLFVIFCKCSIMFYLFVCHGSLLYHLSTDQCLKETRVLT